MNEQEAVPDPFRVALDEVCAAFLTEWAARDGKMLGMDEDGTGTKAVDLPPWPQLHPDTRDFLRQVFTALVREGRINFGRSTAAIELADAYARGLTAGRSEPMEIVVEDDDDPDDTPVEGEHWVKESSEPSGPGPEAPGGR